MKTKELIKDINKSRSLSEQITMEIGELYAEYMLTKNDQLLTSANAKVDVLKKVNDHIKELEKDILINNT